MARRGISLFGLSFLDAMTCGLGAVVLVFVIINASVGVRAGRMTGDLEAEVDRLQDEVLDGYKDLVELRNSVREIEEQLVVARGLSRRVLEQIEAIRIELATFDADTVAREEHINRLKADLQSLEEDVKRLSAAAPTDEMPGDKTRVFVGDGDRQYLTGLKVGGERILILVDASASMLDDTIVNIVRLSLMSDAVKLRSEKWQQAVSTVDWVTTQIPRDSRFQIYTFNERLDPVIPETRGQWLDGSDREVLDAAVDALRRVVPQDGTSLHQGFLAIQQMEPPPDNIILLVDGLPTMGATKPRGTTVTGKQRVKHFNKAVKELSLRIPINVILFPIEGDPIAASAYWKLAVATRGSFLSPSEDWP
jgi:hypothetical protein